MASPSRPIAPTAANLASWTNADRTPNLCNVLILSLIKPISKEAAIASNTEPAHCWCCSQPFNRRTRPLVQIPCDHVFCKQCILGHWRTPARQNPIEPEPEQSEDDWPWACKCPVCEEQWKPIEAVWEKRDYAVEAKMGMKMVEYMTVPDTYFRDRKKGARGEVLEVENWDVIGLQNDQTKPQWVQGMVTTLNAFEDQSVKVEETVRALVQAATPVAQNALANGGRLGQAQANEVDRAAQKLVLLNVREFRWRGMTDPEHFALNLQDAWIYAGGSVDEESGEWIIHE